MMESKAIIYAVLAVALGYLLISVVPSRLAAVPEENLRSERGDAFSLAEAPPVAGSEAQPPPESGIWSITQTLGVWIVDLMIALGVYLVVKRRLS